MCFVGGGEAFVHCNFSVVIELLKSQKKASSRCLQLVGFMGHQTQKFRVAQADISGKRTFLLVLNLLFSFHEHNRFFFFFFFF